MKVNMINQQFLMTLADCKYIHQERQPPLHRLTDSLWLNWIVVIVTRITGHDAIFNQYKVKR